MRTDRMATALLLVLATLMLTDQVWAQGMSNTRGDWLTPGGGGTGTSTGTVIPDYLNPFTAEQPEWDPYAPGTGLQVPRAPWDPFAPYGAAINLRLEEADPVELGLEVKTPDIPQPRLRPLRLPVEIYLQVGNVLQGSGTVILGEPIILWVQLARAGNLYLYDNGKMIISQNYLIPRWYRVQGLTADILTPRLFQVFSGGLAGNNVTVSVSPGGYPSLKALVGRVIDQNGYGMARVTVRITSNEGGSFTTQTDSMGFYGMDVPSGTYVITASQEGYTFSQSFGNVWTGTVSAAGVIVGMPVVPTPASSQSPAQYQTVSNLQGIRGQVLDGSGNPIASALVSTGPVYDMSDELGKYQIALDPGWFTITIEKPGFTFLPVAVEVRSGQVVQMDITAS